MTTTHRGNIVDILNRQIFFGEVIVLEGKMEKITRLENNERSSEPYMLPGFIDAHVHIESSMLVPSQFARLAVVHGTVATVSDPHEIANVCGMQGVEYMIEDGKTVPFKFYFGAPSCVPATPFETAGAVVDVKDIEQLLQRSEIRYLSEMMNFPGVLNSDEEVLQKIAAAKKWGKPVDGHAPGLRGEKAKKYIDAGITTDHECFTEEEALDKLQQGMKIIIREGSAAKNFDALINLLHHYPDQMMFCSDDKHPDSLVKGHINDICTRAVKKGFDVFKVLQAACVNPVLHYGLEVGLLKEGDAADFIMVKDLETFTVLQTFIDGKLVAEKGKSLIESRTSSIINYFNCAPINPEDLFLPYEGQDTVFVIEALDGQLITNKIIEPVISVLVDDRIEQLKSNLDKDVLKIIVVNRYVHSKVAVGFIKNFGLKKGAIASSVAHDSHNIVAVGVDDESICKAVNLIIEHKGGVSCVNLTPSPSPMGEGSKELILPLLVGGLMSTEDGYEVARNYSAIDTAAKELGSTLSAPFMTLSFMALLVIPHLKLSDKGLFDGDEFTLMYF